jgi:hypothetical protein
MAVFVTWTMMLAITLLSFSNLSDIVVRKERKMTGMTEKRTDREKYRKTEIQSELKAIEPDFKGNK